MLEQLFAEVVQIKAAHLHTLTEALTLDEHDLNVTKSRLHAEYHTRMTAASLKADLLFITAREEYEPLLNRTQLVLDEIVARKAIIKAAMSHDAADAFSLPREQLNMTAIQNMLSMIPVTAARDIAAEDFMGLSNELMVQSSLGIAALGDCHRVLQIIHAKKEGDAMPIFKDIYVDDDDLMRWSVGQVVEWANNHGLSAIGGKLAEHKIDGYV